MTPTSTPIRRSSSYTTTLDAKATLSALKSALNSVLLGKEQQVQLALACLLARGHLLIEDLPGMGKTLLSHALAKVLGLSYNRIQFTSDVLPADVIGTSIFDRDNGAFRFIEGPLFAQVVLADEINRATPKSQSALLEAMEERQVTVEGETRSLPEPFFVIATQNPSTQAGTFPLPESQLDRFLMRIELGYPDPDAERELLKGGDRRQSLTMIEPVVDLETLAELQGMVDEIKVSDPLIEYIQRLVGYSRRGSDFAFGLSSAGQPGAAAERQSLGVAAGSLPCRSGRCAGGVAGVVEHRLREAADYTGHGGGALAQKLLTSVDVVG